MTTAPRSATAAGPAAVTAISASAAAAPLRCARAAMFAAVCTALGAFGHAYMSGRDVPAGGLLAAFGLTAGAAWLAAGRRRGTASIAGALLAVQGVLHLVFADSQGAGVGVSAGTGAGAGAAGGHGGGGQGAHGGHAVAAANPSASAAHAGHHPHAAPEAASAAGPAETAGVAGPGGGVDLGGAAAPGGSADAAGLADLGGTADFGDLGGFADLAGLADLGMAGHGGFGMVGVHLLAALFCAFWLARGESAVFRLARALRALGVRVVGRVRIRVVAVRPAPPRVRRSRRYEPPRALRGAVHAHAVVRRGPPARATARATAPGRPACA
ncbi:hypothetical protein [Streptomyces bambusae]|uniref:PE-PGRS family protein n=1 Tax=Streptomyces bambusae TaxID=1550616 RepID=A0ABS6YZV5_9ACTN|nr:hypothetical protein [Streptomyces bambusae]MBW5481019.1 hypothetical protein [Streptomyces bambusae]